MNEAEPPVWQRRLPRAALLVALALGLAIAFAVRPPTRWTLATAVDDDDPVPGDEEPSEDAEPGDEEPPDGDQGAADDP